MLKQNHLDITSLNIDDLKTEYQELMLKKETLNSTYKESNKEFKELNRKRENLNKYLNQEAKEPPQTPLEKKENMML